MKCIYSKVSVTILKSQTYRWSIFVDDFTQIHSLAPASFSKAIIFSLLDNLAQEIAESPFCN